MAIDLWEPFGFAFFRNGMVAATLAGAICGAIGVYVVLRGMSYIGHGLSHAVFGGAAASAVAGVNYYAGAGVWGVLSGLAVGRVARRRALGVDAAIGVVTTASFALGIVLFNRFGRARRSLEAVLFGDVLGVRTSDVSAVVGVGVAVVVVLTFGHRRLLFATFDPEVAEVSGIRTGVVDAVLMVLLSLTVLATMRVTGVLLVSALLVIPASTARLLTNSFNRMLLISPILGAASGAVGMLVSYHADTSAGATVILVSAAVFTVVFGASGAAARRRVSGVDDHGDAPRGNAAP